MLRNLRSVENRKVIATDGDAGTIVGFLLDDDRWVVRYLVVETGGFVGGRKLLVSPISLRRGAGSQKGFQVALTIDKIQYTPTIDLNKPISRQQELEYHRYHGYSPYWGRQGLWGEGPHPSTLATARRNDVPADDVDQAEASAVHLRPCAEIRGYDIVGADGAIGRVSDFIVDEDTWELRYLLVESDPTRVREDASMARQALIPAQWVKPVLGEAKLQVDLSRESVASSPELNGGAVIDREYEVRLYSHYQRPGYWEVSVPAIT